MKIEIKHRWSGSVLFSIECSSIKEAVQAAVKAKTDLRGSDLRGSNLRGSDLSGSDLSGSDLSGSDLRGSDLSDSDLRGSNLSGSNLSDSDLSGSNLRGSNLSDSDLSDSDLRGSDLRGSNLRGSDLRPIRDDFWAVLSAMPSEVQGLRDAVAEGRINGSQYDGECACLVGTLAKVKGCHYQSCGLLKPDSNRPSERLFLNIKQGDTPATNPTSKIVLEWTDQWLANMRAAFGTKTTP